MRTQPPHRPDDASGYDETQPTERPRSTHDQPAPDAAGNQHAQVEAAHPREPGTDEPGHEPTPLPGDETPVPPGEHKREPINDPDPADTKLHVREASR